MQIDKNKIKENLKDRLFINSNDLDEKLINEYVDEICNLSINIVTSLSEAETYYVRRRLGVYNDGEKEQYRIVAEHSNAKAQNICIAVHNAYNNMLKKIKSGVVSNKDDMTKMSSLLLSTNYRNVDISKLNLNSRIRRVLSMEVHNIYDLLSYGFDDLEKMGLGIDSINCLVDKMHELGLKFIDELTDDERKIVVSMSNIKMINNSSLAWLKNIDKSAIKNIYFKRTIGNLKEYYMKTGDLSDEVLADANKVGIHMGIFKMTPEDIINSNMTIEEILNIPINNIDFKLRTYNALSRYGIKNIGDIIKFTISDLKKIRGINDIGADEIVDFIHASGLCFRNERTKMSIYTGRIYKGLEPFVSGDITKKRELIEEYRFLKKVKDKMEYASERIHSEVMEQMKKENIQKTLKK